MKPQKKQSKKAATLLTKIEKLLADVLTECSAIEKSLEKNFRQLLRTAEVSIAAAKEFVTPGPAPKVHHKAVTKRAPRPAARTKKRPIARAA